GRASSKTAARPAAPNVRSGSRSGPIGSVARRNPAAAGTGRMCRCAPPSQVSWRLPLLRTLQFEVTLARPLQDPPLRFATLASVITLAFALPRHAVSQNVRVEITVPASLRGTPVTGRIYLFVTRHDDVEPRLQVRHESDCTPFFGVDVTQLAPGAPGVIDGTTPGYPVSSPKEIPAWWGRPIYLGATVLLPRGYDADTGRRYPTVYQQGHFTLNPPFGFSTDSSPETPEQRAARLARSAREPGFEFYRAWSAPNFPR